MRLVIAQTLLYSARQQVNRVDGIRIGMVHALLFGGIQAIMELPKTVLSGQVLLTE